MTTTVKEKRFDGQVALVTGAGSGIGAAAARAFGREGARVVLAGRRRTELESVATEIEKSGGRAAVIPADLADANAPGALVKSVVDRFGRLDVAFNNAGTTAYAPIEALSVDDFDRVIATNVRGVWLLLKHEIEAMRAKGIAGAIVNTSSIAATGGTAGLSAYAASKGALDAMIRALALEVGGQGIRINNVSPGIVRTPMTSELPAAAFEHFATHAALKRIGEPDDIARAALWLCSADASFVTGQSLLVDGGFNIAGAR